MVMHMKDAVENTAGLFKAVAEPNRLRILMMLRIRPMCVCEITYVLGLDQSTVSRHLAKLKRAGLIADERKGQWVDFKIRRPKGGFAKSEIFRLIAKELGASEIVRRDAKRAERADRRILCR